MSHCPQAKRWWYSSTITLNVCNEIIYTEHTKKNSYRLKTSKNKDENNFSCKGFTFIWEWNTWKHTLYNASFTEIIWYQPQLTLNRNSVVLKYAWNLTWTNGHTDKNYYKWYTRINYTFFIHLHRCLSLYSYKCYVKWQQMWLLHHYAGLAEKLHIFNLPYWYRLTIQTKN